MVRVKLMAPREIRMMKKIDQRQLAIIEGDWLLF